MESVEFKIISSAISNYQIRQLESPAYKIVGVAIPITKRHVMQLLHFAKQGVKVRLK